MTDIIFQNLRSGIAINCSPEFEGGRFIFDASSKSIIPNSNPQQTFNNLSGICISIDKEINDQNELQDVATIALEKARGIFAAMAAKFYTHMYLDTPITFLCGDKQYIFHELWVEELSQFKNTHFIGGGSGFCIDLKFLNNKKFHRLIFDFYSEAQNDSNPIDYRALQLWRFFEGWFNLKDQALVKSLINLKKYQFSKGYDNNGNRIFKNKKITARMINGFYRFSRCAVSHGGGSRSSHSKKIIIPRRASDDLWLTWYFHDVLNIASSFLRNKTK